MMDVFDGMRNGRKGEGRTERERETVGSSVVKGEETRRRRIRGVTYSDRIKTGIESEDSDNGKRKAHRSPLFSFGH